MKKKNIINKLIVAPLVMGFMSCTGNYMDINGPPNKQSVNCAVLTSDEITVLAKLLMAEPSA